MEEKDYIFHQEAMDEKLARIRDHIYGYHVPVSRYICGKKGIPSDAKIEKLANKLIGRMGSYCVMDGASIRFVRLYMYLASRVYDEETKLKTFGDIPNILRNTIKSNSYGSLEELVLDGFLYHGWDQEMWLPCYSDGFFENLGRSYMKLAGHSIGADLTEGLQGTLD